VKAFADKGSRTDRHARAPDSLRTQYTTYFATLATAAQDARRHGPRRARGESDHGRAPRVHQPRRVTTMLICDSELADGWYPELFFDRANSTKFDPDDRRRAHGADRRRGESRGQKLLHVGTGRRAR